YILRVIEGTSGNSGTILLVGYGAPVALVLAYYAVVRPMGATRPVHEALLRVPIIGRVVRSLALARFSLIMHLMYEAGTPLRDALRRALEGAGNAAFAARARVAVATLEGGTLTEALQNTGLFPVEDLNIVAVAEESGKLSERLDWLAAHHADQAEAGLRALVIVTARLIYVAVAVVIIFFIVKFFMRYASALQAAAGR
ncbi:MAG: type II secretion system F family protein, partial [Planctomycetota bacterium]